MLVLGLDLDRSAGEGERGGEKDWVWSLVNVSFHRAVGCCTSNTNSLQSRVSKQGPSTTHGSGSIAVAQRAPNLNWDGLP